MLSSSLKPLVFWDNREWLRYVLLGCAAGMCVLAFNSVTETERDVGKIVGGTLGALLLGFSGYVLQVRRLVVDPTRLEISVTSNSLAKTATDRFRFDEVIKLLLLRTYEHDEELLPANRQCERWSVLFVLKDRTIPITTSPSPTKEQALREAKRIQQLLRVEISDNPEEGLTQLAHAGHTIDAVVVARQQLGMTLVQAKEHIEQTAGRRKPPL